MLSDGARRLVNLWSIKPAERAFVITADDRGLGAAADLEAAGVEVVGVVDLREGQPPNIEARGRRSHVESVAVNGRVTRCDLLVMSGSPQPNYKLLAQAGARVVYDDSSGVFVPTDLPPNVEAVGAAAGDIGEARRARARARLPGRQVLRLLLRGPDDEGPEVRDRRGVRLDRAVEAVHDRDDGAVPGPPLPRQLDPRLREGHGARREHDRDDDRAAAALARDARPPGRPAAGARQADVAPPSPRGARRDDDVDGRVEAPALVRARPRRGGEPRPRRRRPDRRLDAREDPRHRARGGRRSSTASTRTASPT